MNTQLLIILGKLQRKSILLEDAHDEILSLLDENKKGVSDSTQQNGVSPLVAKSECEADRTTEVDNESAPGTLQNRIDSEKICSVCKNTGWLVDQYSYDAYECQCPIGQNLK